MQIELNNINNEWLRKVIAQSVLSKTEGLLRWQQKKLFELQDSITDTIELAPNDINDAKLDKLSSQYAQFETDNEQLSKVFAAMKANYKKSFNEDYIATPAVTSNARARAQAIIAKRS